VLSWTKRRRTKPKDDRDCRHVWHRSITLPDLVKRHDTASREAEKESWGTNREACAVDLN